MNLDNSLPSHSSFIVPTRGQAQHDDFMDHGLPYPSNSDPIEDGRGSPPPPPPPPSTQMSSTAGASVDNARSTNRNSRSSRGGPGGPAFPFLRKNSRKEPSALHRIASPSKSPTNHGGATGNTPSPDSQHAQQRGLQNGSQYEEDVNDDDGGDVFLSGSAYWQGDTTQQTNKNSSSAAPHRRSTQDALDQSTISIAGNQWQQQRNAVQNELEEFELIEKQLENSSTFNPSATRASVQSSAQFNNRAHTQHDARSDLAGTRNSTMRNEERDAEEEDEYRGDWDDAYEHEEQFETAGKSTSKSFGLNSTNPYALDESIDSASNGTEHTAGAEKSFGRSQLTEGIRSTRPMAQKEDSMSSDVDDTDFTSTDRRSAPATGSEAVRPNVIQPNRGDGRHQERSVSPNAGASARVGSSNTNLASDPRAAESPSWGRVTRPSHDSFSEQAPYDYSQASDQRDTMKVARMSNSALKKISSRTAALHNPPASHRVDRPSLADDANLHAPEEYSEQDEVPSREVVYTRPVSAQRRLANTHSGGSATGVAAKPRSGSAGGRLAQRGNGAGGGAVGDSSNQSQAALNEKARDLAAELETYRSENANLKKLRRQQEAALSEVVSQKEELVRWVAEEKARTLKWCEEQQQAATRERNAAAKMARESRQKALSGTVPIRKEKAEIEGLQATIEKMKLDHEQAAKKWKLSENRLYALVKEHVAHIESSEKQLLTLEQEKLQLLEFIGEQGLRLPKQLRSALQRTPLYRTPESNKPGAAASGRTGSGTGTSSVAMDVVRGRTSRGRNSADGYAEEVDVEYTEGSSSSYYAHPHEADRAHSNTVPSKLANTAGGAAEPWERETRASKPMRSPASPKTKGSSGKLAATYQPGEVFNRQSSNLRSGTTTLSHRDVRGGGTGAGVDVGSSWARSSGGSRSSAGRYDDAASDYEGAADEAEGAEMDQGEDFDAPLRGSGAHDVRLSSTKTSPTSAAAAGHSVSHSHSQSQSGAMLKQTLRDPHHHAQTSAPAGTATSATAAAADPAAGRTEQVLPDGRKIIKYKNGTEKEVDTSGNSVVRFLNGDTKSVNPTSGVVIYYYAQAETTHTTFKDGLEVYEFPNKQVEMHFPDGIKEIIFPDGTRKIINPDGMQESHFPDGVVLREHADGRKEVLSADA